MMHLSSRSRYIYWVPSIGQDHKVTDGVTGQIRLSPQPLQSWEMAVYSQNYLII